MNKNNEKLVVVWTSGDREVALKMVFMYSLNSKLKGWWNDVTFIIWGPSSSLLAQDYEIQEYIKRLMKNGVILEACKSCTEMYGVTKKLEQMNIDVKYIGETFTKYIKEGRTVITF